MTLKQSHEGGRTHQCPHLPVGELKLRERARPPVEEHTAHRWPKPQTRCVCFLCQAGALGVGTQPRSSLGPTGHYRGLSLAWFRAKWAVSLWGSGWEHFLPVKPHSCCAREDGAVFLLPCVGPDALLPSTFLQYIRFTYLSCLLSHPPEQGFPIVALLAF